MLRLTRRRVAGALASLILATAGADVPADRNPGVDRLAADAARMYGFVKSPHPGELKWQKIPWLTDLREGIRQARAENRPLVLFVSGDDPLEKC
jgi:hypothetical protein